MAKRVFELARDLGVTSKDVLDKCRAEGIELKNHMAALSAGLVATIQEWFSESSATTAVETSEHIDLGAVREKAAVERRRRQKGAAAEAGEAEAAAQPLAEAPAAEPVVAEEAVAVAVAEAPPAVAPTAPPVAAEAPAAQVVIEQAAPPSAVAPVRAAQAVAQAVPVAPPPPVTEPPPAAAQARPQPHAPPAKPVRDQVEKKPVVPAGPQVVPRPAKLQGPRVVRFEGIELDQPVRRPASRYGAPAAGPPPVATTPGRKGTVKPGTAAPSEEEEEGKAKKGGVKKRSPRRRSGRGAEPAAADGLRSWRSTDLVERSERLAAASGSTLRRHRAQVGQARHNEPGLRGGPVEVVEPVTVKALSAATGLKSSELMRKLLALGNPATINQVLARQTVEMLALEMGLELKVKAAKTVENQMEEELANRQPADPSKMVTRAPVVTFLGHVDHGKTSLLDRIRHATVAATEEGGITQHFGAYRYDVGGKHVVFLDTPGHEAFTAMRARGANMTDVVVLVVAADDGMMPQTLEALNHAKAAKVPIVVALNKVDLPNANIQRAMGQLAEHGLQARQWGGQTEIIETSATTGQGIDALVETLSLEAELLELKGDPAAPATGYVMETRRDPNKGILARFLVKDGTLHVSDVVLCGQTYGRVRSLTDDRGRPIQAAGPSTPVEVAGLDGLPEAGDKFFIVEDLTAAREVAEARKDRARQQNLAGAPQTTLQNMLAQIEAGKTTELKVVLKCDVQGSLEALNKSLTPLSNEEVKLVILHSGVGGITEGDVLLAEASGAVLLGFRVVADQRGRMLAEQKGVEIRTYLIIYQLIDDLAKAVRGLIAPVTTEKVMGRASVREVFKISRVGTVAGCHVLDGQILRSARIRIIRDNVVLETGRQLESLRRFKDDVREVRAGLECGLKVSGYDDLKIGDVIEAYQSVEVPRT